MPIPTSKEHSDKGLSSILACPHCQEPIYYCPIPGCEKQFKKGISGWDGHINSNEHRSNWKPRIQNYKKRNRKLKKKFSNWLDHAKDRNR